MLTVAHMAHHRLTTVARHPSVACPVSSAHQAIGWPGELPWCLLWITELSYSKCFSIAFCSSKIESKSSRACTSSVCSCLSCWQILFILSINLISIQWLDSPFTKSLPLVNLYAHASVSTHVNIPSIPAPPHAHAPNFYPDEVSHTPNTASNPFQGLLTVCVGSFQIECQFLVVLVWVPYYSWLL